MMVFTIHQAMGCQTWDMLSVDWRHVYGDVTCEQTFSRKVVAMVTLRLGIYAVDSNNVHIEQNEDIFFTLSLTLSTEKFNCKYTKRGPRRVVHMWGNTMNNSIKDIISLKEDLKCIIFVLVLLCKRFFFVINVPVRMDSSH